MKNGNLNKSFLTIFIALFIFGGVFFVIGNTHGQTFDQAGDYGLQGAVGGTVAGDYIKVGDSWVLKSSWQGRLESLKSWAKDLLYWKDVANNKTIAATAFKAGIKNFLNRLAYDTATYLATGDKGQSPMFRTDSVGGFLQNAADYAAGDFLGALSKGALGARFNICELDPNLRMQLGFGLLKSYRPRNPDCTFSQMKKNWEKSLQDPNFLNRFQAVFDPRQNDLGRALTVHSGFGAAIDNKVKQSSLELSVNQGWKNVTDSISGYIKTPSTMVRKYAEDTFGKSTDAETIFTGDIVADAFDTFVNTLISKLAEKWLKNGLVMKFPNNSYQGNWGGFADSNSGPYKEGIQGAEERFLNLKETSFNVRGDYEVLGELTACPNPQKAGPTNCVITDKFRQAVSEKLSVGEAIKKGYLNSAGIFGFNADGLEPNFNEGYPYRSMLILRKFRIIPVGWELAAEYINNNQKTVGAKNLGDLVACFSPDDEYEGYYQAWCDGLVDPNWVLKAPLNFCKKEGFGPEITTSRVMGTGKDSELVIGRNDNYCADEQACIKEKDDGSCELYGYCTEEKRKWDFNGESCEPVYNTCQTFKGKDGQNVSYLENTLDYTGCDADNAGCTGYCQDYDINTKKYTCDASNGNKIYLDASAETCDASAEGCHEFIRTKGGLGANLFPNSSFEETTVWPQSSEDSFEGQYSAKLGAGIPDTLLELSASEANLAGLSITFSLYMKKCGANAKISIGTGQGGTMLTRTEKVVSTSDSEWRRYEVTHFTPNEASRRQIFINIEDYTAGCYVDALKVEFGEKATAYSAYRATGLFHEKIIPDYLKKDCYVNASTGNYSLKSGYPKECDNYSRLCNSDEVGCTMYTAEKDKMSIPARILPEDYCPSECVGYDEYHQMPSAFDSQRPFYFVPSSATKCSSAAVGCDEFTNLDKLGAGAEAREYYSELKQCRKPDNLCREFYTWEGSGDTGYQLRVYQMEGDGQTPYGPKQTRDIVGACDASIYALPATDPAYNPDCREFYNKDGQITYRLYSLTISCSDDCHPYRRSENNILKNVAEAQTLCVDECGADNVCKSACTPIDCENDSNGKVCEFDNKTAAFCQNGGLWNSQHGRCLYNAVPGEGKKCGEAQAGCREYSGPNGNDINFVLNTDIESGSTENWTGDLPPAQNPSSEALVAGGHSLFVSGLDNQIAKTLGQALSKGKSYTISFVAKKDSAGSGNGFVEIGFGVASAVVKFELGAAVNYELGSDWRLYRFNLTELDNAAGTYKVDDAEKLFIKADGAFFIDSIRLSEITDRYYLVKNSWKQEACLYDTVGNPVGDIYNLGCAAYRDNDNVLYNLRKFTLLCQDSAVGCELMVDTHNSTGFASSTSLAGIDPVINVPKDSFVYAVYNKNKLCNEKDKGCERLGKPYKYGSGLLFSDLYLKNDPDVYDKTVCDKSADDCRSWNGNSGAAYFKDPGEEICEYRTKTGENNLKWYKKQAKRCDIDGNKSISGAAETSDANICLSNDDCLTGIDCLDDKADYLCDITTSKTIGLGGSGGKIDQPTNGWAGLCPASKAGCAEYIDPLSRFSRNILFNSDYKDIDGDGTNGDGWAAGEQAVVLSPNTLYSLRSSGLAGDVFVVNCNDIRILNNNNILLPGTPTVNESNALFLTGTASDCKVQGGANGKNIELKEAVIDYQLKQKINKNACNGLVDFEKGCILLNERTVAGGDGISIRYTENIWDANATFSDGNGIAPFSDTVSEANNDSIVLVKASPDRVCKTWLSCQSFVKDENNNNVCFDVGLCDKFDANGNCANAIQDNSGNLTYVGGIGAYSDYSGYVKVGYGSDDKYKRNDYYSFSNMDQVGEISKVSNGDFEQYGSNDYPLGWNPKNDIWTADKFKTINNPVEAEKEGIKYPMSGKSFLKYSPQLATVESEFFDVEPGAEYVLSAYMNTMNFAVDYINNNNDLAVGVLGIVTYDKTGAITNTNQGGKIVSGGDFDFCAHQPLGFGCQIYLGQKNDWTSIKTKFKVGGATAKIKLQFYGYWHKGFKPATGDWEDTGECKANDKCVGTVFADDIKIYPALHAYSSDYENPVATSKMNMQWLTNSWSIDWLKEKTCRLYPKDDSLSCEYLNNSGVKEKGLYGYCLEYDRYPGNKDACLLWYPVDKVKGDGIEEGAGYLGKYPAYYCVEKQDLVKLEKRRFIMDGVTTGCDWDSPPSPSGNYSTVAGSGRPVGQCAGSCDDGDSNYTSSYAPNKASCIYDCQDNGTGWYVYDGFENFNSGHCCPTACDTIDEAKDGVKYYDSETKMVFDDFSMKCTKVVQTVTPIGQNKYWSGRVYKGSDYQFACNAGISELNGICQYTSDAEAFGSITPPGKTWSEVTNPYEWIVPLYYKKSDSNEARMGQLHTVPAVKQIFAQNYGSWKWSSADMRYVKDSALWTPPDSECANRMRNEGEYCYISPKISNLKSDKYFVDNSGFVNLTFNTKVDSQQLPLVMYSINWGDGGSFTTISGVEMRDRQNPAIPHSTYHLYSYWDMRKNNPASCNDVNKFCEVEPKVKIKDNWGKESTWVTLGVKIRIYEKAPAVSIAECDWHGEKIKYGDGVVAYRNVSANCQNSCEAEIRVCGVDAEGVLSGSFTENTCTEQICYDNDICSFDVCTAGVCSNPKDPKMDGKDCGNGKVCANGRCGG